MMARADKAGFLDEAIYLHLIEAYREKSAAKLTAYLETVIVPKH